MVGALLWRGLLLGALAGLLCFAYFKLIGEPALELAIAFEAQHEKAAPPTGAHNHAAPAVAQAGRDELVSRETQAGLGLLVAVTVYGAALGGLFAVAFSLTYGRMAALSARANSAVIAALGFVAVYIVPYVKYPPAPPSVGAGETIGMRTALFFSLVALSLAAIIAAGMLRVRLLPRIGAWNACLAAALAYLAGMVIAGYVFPSVNEVPEHFPAGALWNFRVAALGGQLLLTAVLGIGFGLAAERVFGERGRVESRIASEPRSALR